MNTQTKLIANLVIYAGLVVMFATFIAVAFIPQAPILLSIITGLSIGAVLLLVGFQLHPDSGYSINGGSGSETLPEVVRSKQFLPTRAGFRIFVRTVLIGALFVVPILFFVLLLLMLPVGDNWSIAIARVGIASVAIIVSWKWQKFVRRKFLTDAHNEPSSEMKQPSDLAPPTEFNPPSSFLDVPIKNSSLIVIAIAALLVFWAVGHFQNLQLNPVRMRGRLRGLIHLLSWGLTNPNTIRLASATLATVAFSLLAHRFGRSRLRGKSDASTSS